MTTPPVVSITDELIAELEAAANACESWYVEQDLGITLDLVSDKDNRFVLAASPATILALLVDHADLKRQLAAASVDAERWRYVRDLLHPDDIRDFQLSRVSFGMKPTEYISRQCDDAIDAARNIGGGD